MTIITIQQLLQAKAIQLPAPEKSVTSLMLDTRHLHLPGALFFPIEGERHDGHLYLNDAYQSGVRHFVVRKIPDLSGFPEANILLVEDTLWALQQVAAAHRQQFDIPVIGITGSNGKTIVKEWLYQLLCPQFNIVRSPKSYNSQVGVPLSVWEIKRVHTLAIFEAGISKRGEMERLNHVIKPNIGIFTNIGTAHSDGFSSEKEKIWEKMRLFEGCKQLIACADHTTVMEVLEIWKKDHPAVEIVSWSQKGHPASIAVRVGLEKDKSILSFSWGDDTAMATIPFTDTASIENAVHCFVAGYVMGMETTLLAQRLGLLVPIEMRMEIKSGIDESTLINDFYNNDLSSLQILLQFSRQQSKGKRVTLILSDILQSGQAHIELYRQVALLLKGIDRFIGIGTEITAIQPFLSEKVETAFYPDTAAFLGDITQFSWRNNLILLKGARPFEFEYIAKRLEKKAHQTRLEINLNALIHNLKVYNSLLQPGVKTMAMVKAAAYGSGGAEVARLLEFHKVHYLGVAYADEGIELRQAGVQLPILVLNPDTTGFDVFYRYQLQPEIFSLQILEELIAYTGKEKAMTIHIKLDTGMHRLGFEKADIPALTAVLKLHPNLKVASVFSHLSASDNPDLDDFTHHQAASFLEMYQLICAVLDYAPLRHIANTGGISRFPQYHFDMVRLGVGLYGIDGTGLQNQLQVVNVLKTTVSQVKNIPVGDSVGYNRSSGVLTHPTRIATISIGYADGFLRGAGRGAYKVLINNVLCPIIGNVCMDMSMVDVSHVAHVKAGDEVVVFGHNPSVQSLAECLKTIAYEIFTNISDRVKRVYVQE